MKTNKIKKFEKWELDTNERFCWNDTIALKKKVNEIIDVLNSWLFEPTLTIPSQNLQFLKKNSLKKKKKEKN